MSGGATYSRRGRGGRRTSSAEPAAVGQGNCRRRGAPSQTTLPWPSHWARLGAPVVSLGAIVRAPPNHGDSQHGAKPTTALSTVRAAGRRGEGTCMLLIAAHPTWRGKDWL